MARAVKGKRSPARKAETRFVLHNPVVMAWCFEDESSVYGDSVLDALEVSQAVVPTLWPIEVANALLVGERRKRISQADSQQWVQILGSLPITIDDETSLHVWTSTLNLAREQQLSAYDATYLELAVRLALPLATLDEKLKAAAVAVGVKLFAAR
jgi:predicted nucleic acid-binding protein